MYENLNFITRGKELSDLINLILITLYKVNQPFLA